MRLFLSYSLSHAWFVKVMVEQSTMNGVLIGHVLEVENEELASFLAGMR